MHGRLSAWRLAIKMRAAKACRYRTTQECRVGKCLHTPAHVFAGVVAFAIEVSRLTVGNSAAVWQGASRQPWRLRCGVHETNEATATATAKRPYFQLETPFSASSRPASIDAEFVLMDSNSLDFRPMK